MAVVAEGDRTGGADLGLWVFEFDQWLKGPRWLVRPLRWFLLRLYAIANSPRCHLVVAAVVPLVVILRVTLRELDKALTALGGGMSKLQGADAGKTVGKWIEGSARVRPLVQVRGEALAQWHVGLDSLFVATYLFLLGLAAVLLYRGARRALINPEGGVRLSIRPGHLTMLRAAVVLIPLLAIANLVENTGELAVVGTKQAAFGWVVLVAAWATRILGGLVALTLVVPAIVLARRCEIVSRLWHSASLVRVQFFVAALFGLPCVLGPTAEQAADTVRLWGTRPGHALFATLAVLWFSVTTVVMGAHIISVHLHRQHRLGDGSYPRMIATGLLLFSVGWLLLHFDHWGRGIEVLGGLLFLVGLTSLCFRGQDDRAGLRHRPDQEHRPKLGDDALRRLPAVLGTIPFFVLGSTAVHAAVPEMISSGRGAAVIVIAALVLPFLGSGVYVVSAPHIRVPAERDTYALRPSWWFIAFAGLSGLALVAIWASVFVDVYGVADVFGGMWFVGTFFAGVTLFIGLLGFVCEQFRPPAALGLLGFRRIPVVLLVVVWAVAGTVLDRGSPLHNVRIRDEQQATAGPVSVEDFFAQWAARNAANANASLTAIPAGAKPAVPLVMVASAGGGIKAAAWTAVVVDCLFGQHPAPECGDMPPPGAWDRLFAMSGASGGSVGFASAVAEQLLPRDNKKHVLERLGADLLGPSVAWQLFVETPSILPRANPGTDRAEVLETMWSRQWADGGSVCPSGNPAELDFLRLWSEQACGPHAPLLLLNGTSMLDGCRFNVSPLDGALPYSSSRPAGGRDCAKGRATSTATTLPPGLPPPMFAATRDLLDYVCGDEDVSLATAAFLSARYPFVSPPARIPSPAERGRRGCEANIGGNVVDFDGDGGYRDNTGASALLELWSRLEPKLLAYNRTNPVCVVPLLIQIDSGYQGPLAQQAQGRLFPSIAPLIGATRVFSNRDTLFPQLGQAAFVGPLAPDIAATTGPRSEAVTRYASFHLNAHPGVQAALGWSLSPSARDDVLNQLRVDGNRDAMNTVKSWLEPGALTCKVS